MLRNKRRIFSWIILAVSAILILSGLFVGTPQVSYAPLYETKIFGSSNPQVPSINATIKYEFSAAGSISAQNPISVTVNIIGANVSNLLDYYQAVGFLGAVYNSNTNVTAKNNSETYGFVHFDGNPDGVYNGTSMLIWPAESEVYAFLIPQSWYQWTLQAGPEAGQQPIAHISGISNTLAWKYNEETTRLVLIATGFGVLAVQPILEAVFRRKDASKS